MVSSGYAPIPQSDSLEGGTASSGTSNGSKKKKIIAGLLIFLVVLALCGAGGFCVYWFLFRNKGDDSSSVAKDLVTDVVIVVDVEEGLIPERVIYKEDQCVVQYLGAIGESLYLSGQFGWDYNVYAGRQIGHKFYMDPDCNMSMDAPFPPNKTGVECPDLKNVTPSGMQPPKYDKCDYYELHDSPDPSTELVVKLWMHDKIPVILEQLIFDNGAFALRQATCFVRFETKYMDSKIFDLPKDVLVVNLTDVNSTADTRPNFNTRKINYLHDVVLAPVSKRIGHKTNSKRHNIPLFNHFPNGNSFNMFNGKFTQMTSTNSKFLKVKEVRRAPTKEEVNAIPKSYDVREKYGHLCPSVSQIYNEDYCGAAWAIAAVSSFSDRVCLATNGTINTELSAQYTLLCQKDAWGCLGGSSDLAWASLHKQGTTSETCTPYTEDSGDCPSECVNKSEKRVIYKAGKPVSTFTPMGWKENMEMIQLEIIRSGPVQTSFYVFDDFLDYESGIYRRTSTEYEGIHTVRILGWGEEDSVPYWIAASDWGTSWGEEGTFRILRGTNDCGFEDAVISADYDPKAL